MTGPDAVATISVHATEEVGITHALGLAPLEDLHIGGARLKGG